eukprot:UN28352
MAVTNGARAFSFVSDHNFPIIALISTIVESGLSFTTDFLFCRKSACMRFEFFVVRFHLSLP